MDELYRGGDDDVDDRGAEDEDEEESKYNYDLIKKVMSDDHKVAENLDEEELEAIADSFVLKQAY